MELHALLRRQLRRAGEEIPTDDSRLSEFHRAINAAYFQFDHDRKMLERSLELSSAELLEINAEMKAVFAAFPDLMVIVNYEGEILEVKASDTTVVLATQLKSREKKFQDLFVFTEAREITQTLERVRTTKIATSVEHSWRQNGKHFFFESRILPLPGERLIIILRDITSRRNAQDEQFRLVSIVEHCSEGIIGTSLNGTISSWNKSAEKIFGYSYEDKKGINISSLFDASNRQTILDLIAKVKDGQGFCPLEISGVRMNGSELELSLAVSPILDPYENLIGVSWIVQDITERKYQQLHLLHAQKLESIGQLSAGIAHETIFPGNSIRP